jgi:hypothetical protein
MDNSTLIMAVLGGLIMLGVLGSVGYASVYGGGSEVSQETIRVTVVVETDQYTSAAVQEYAASSENMDVLEDTIEANGTYQDRLRIVMDMPGRIDGNEYYYEGERLLVGNSFEVDTGKTTVEGTIANLTHG